MNKIIKNIYEFIFGESIPSPEEKEIPPLILPTVNDDITIKNSSNICSAPTAFPNPGYKTSYCTAPRK